MDTIVKFVVNTKPTKNFQAKVMHPTLAELMTLNRLLNLPWRLSKEQLSWLKNRLKDRRPDVRALAQEQYEMRFPPRHLEDDEFNFFDEESFIE